jgi:plasmid stabilization system protein ParE
VTSVYVLTAAAEADLRSIIRYTRQHWGNAQTRRYIAQLTTGFEQIAGGQGKDMSSLHPGLLMARCQHHYLFCLPRPDAPALIVAILHERMDLMARLADRLRD